MAVAHRVKGKTVIIDADLPGKARHEVMPGFVKLHAGGTEKIRKRDDPDTRRLGTEGHGAFREGDIFLSDGIKVLFEFIQFCRGRFRRRPPGLQECRKEEHGEDHEEHRKGKGRFNRAVAMLPDQREKIMIEGAQAGAVFFNRYITEEQGYAYQDIDDIGCNAETALTLQVYED